MTVVKIAHSVPADAVARVRSMFQQLEKQAPAFNGADIAGAGLLSRVYAAIDAG